MNTIKYTRRVAINLVIANMIGTGIFSSLGFQVHPEFGIPDAFAILLIWLLGGIIALCGATVYGEIASTINESGGEYTFLSRLYHPVLGFISGWSSIFVGFSAAIAVLAIATGEYFSPVLGLDKTALFLGVPFVKILAVTLIVAVTFVHLKGVKAGGQFQNYVTYIKLSLIVIFLLIPFLFHNFYEPAEVSFLPSENSWDTIFSMSFAGSLVWVMFAYSGWNASTYIVGSLDNPKKNLPYSLLIGTIIVTVLYILLNFVFMYVATFDELLFKPDLGNVVAQKVLGKEISLFFSCIFSFALISGLSAMFIAGPKVIEAMGRDYSFLKVLGEQSKNGTPNTAIITLMTVSVVLTIFVDFQNLIEFTGFTLSIFSLLTVGSVFIIRFKKIQGDHIVRSFGYPFTPLVFMALSLWMIYFFVSEKPEIIWWFVVSIFPALLIYAYTIYIKKRSS